jgi:hypothetical protein
MAEVSANGSLVAAAPLYDAPKLPLPLSRILHRDLQKNGAPLSFLRPEDLFYF